MEESKAIKWFIKVLFNDGSEFRGFSSANSDVSNEAIREIIGDHLNPFTVFTPNQNAQVIINPANVSAIFFYNNEQYED